MLAENDGALLEGTLEHHPSPQQGQVGDGHLAGSLEGELQLGLRHLQPLHEDAFSSRLFTASERTPLTPSWTRADATISAMLLGWQNLGDSLPSPDPIQERRRERGGGGGGGGFRGRIGGGRKDEEKKKNR